jgi:porphobilinogen deaminase
MRKEKIYTGLFFEGISDIQMEQVKMQFKSDLSIEWSQESVLQHDLFAPGGRGFPEKDVDSFYCLPLESMPIHLPAPYAAAALIMRAEPRSYLIIRKDNLDNTQDLFLKSQSKIVADSLLFIAQFKFLRPDLDWILSSSEVAFSSDIDALITCYPRQDFTGNEWEIFVLSPFESIPQPGAGALVIICQEQNFDLRKRLSLRHSMETAKCTNAERRLLKMLPTELVPWFGAYCSKDAQSNYQMVACLSHPELGLSTWKYSSTGVQAVENYMAAQIHNWISTH